MSHKWTASLPGQAGQDVFETLQKREPAILAQARDDKGELATGQHQMDLVRRYVRFGEIRLLFAATGHGNWTMQSMNVANVERK